MPPVILEPVQALSENAAVEGDCPGPAEMSFYGETFPAEMIRCTVVGEGFATTNAKRPFDEVYPGETIGADSPSLPAYEPAKRTPGRIDKIHRCAENSLHERHLLFPRQLKRLRIYVLFLSARAEPAAGRLTAMGQGGGLVRKVQGFQRHLRRISPQPLKLIKRPYGMIEDMYDNLIIVKKYPGSPVKTLNA